MNSSELINIYIDKLIKHVSELTKTNILMSAQITFYESNISTLNEKINSLEKALDKANSKPKKTDKVENDF
jgi:chaperonin cofactor prefoldin